MARASGRSPLRLLELSPGDFAALLELVVADQADRGKRMEKRAEASKDMLGLGVIGGVLQTIAEEV